MAVALTISASVPASPILRRVTLRILLGGNFRTRVLSYSESFPLDGALTVGAGLNVGDGDDLIYLPVGFTRRPTLRAGRIRDHLYTVRSSDTRPRHRRQRRQRRRLRAGPWRRHAIRPELVCAGERRIGRSRRRRPRADLLAVVDCTRAPAYARPPSCGRAFSSVDFASKPHQYLLAPAGWLAGTSHTKGRVP